MLTCTPQLADKKVIEGVALHFISVDATLERERETIVVEGLNLDTDAPAFVVVQAFLQTEAGQSAANVVATTVTAANRTQVCFDAQRLAHAPTPDLESDAAPNAADTETEALALRFDLLVRE